MADNARYTQKFISVWLKRTTKPYMLHCMICMARLGQVPGIPDKIAEVHASQEGAMKAPFIFKCPGFNDTHGKCPCIYVVEGFLE